MKNLKQAGKAKTLRLYQEAKDLNRSGYSWYKIARILQLNESTVYRWLKTNRDPGKWGRPGRNGSMVPCSVCGKLIWRDTRRLNQRHFYCPDHRMNIPDKSVILTPKLVNFLDGLVLGDGSIIQVSQVSASYQQASALRRKEWLDTLKVEFERFGITCKTSIGKSNGWDSAFLRTSAYPALLSMRERWYPNGHKEIAEDVEISRQLLANWYFGDGHLTKGNGAYLYSLWPERLPVEKLAQKISQCLSIPVRVHPRREHNIELYYIHIPIAYSQVFLDYIKDFYTLCFGYKFALKRSPLRRWSSNEIELLKQQYPHQPANDIAKELTRPLRAVYVKAFKLGLKRYEKN